MSKEPDQNEDKDLNIGEEKNIISNQPIRESLLSRAQNALRFLFLAKTNEQKTENSVQTVKTAADQNQEDSFTPGFTSQILHINKGEQFNDAVELPEINNPNTNTNTTNTNSNANANSNPADIDPTKGTEQPKKP